MLETLESRVLFSSAAASSGLLTITGTSSSDTIDVGLSSGRITVSGVSSTYANITGIVVNAGGGNDKVTVANVVGNLPTTLNGGSGDDRLNGGTGNDRINGEDGADR